MDLFSLLLKSKTSSFKTRLILQYMMLLDIIEWNRMGGTKIFIDPFPDVSDAEYKKMVRSAERRYRRSHRKRIKAARIGLIDAVRMIRKAGRWDFTEFNAYTIYDKWNYIQDERVKRVREYVMENSRTGGVHGIDHWDRVYANGQLLITSRVNSLVVGLFAYLHDFCREDDGDDLQHGPRAAKFVDTVRDTLLKDVCDEDIRLLKEACSLHTVADRTGNPTIDACFDADRLDLGRVGIVPDPAKLATRKGKEIARLQSKWN
jgi:uncharacterized protein